MKIWIPSIKTGSGADVYMTRLAESLSSLGLTVELQWFPMYFELCPLLLRNIKPPAQTDIIFVNSWTAIAFTQHNIPVVSFVHHCVHDPGYRPFKTTAQAVYHQLLILPLEKAGLQGSSKVVVGSHFTQQQVQQSFNIKACLIPHSIDTNNFCPPKSNSKSRKNQPFKLLFIGNQSKRKGFDLLAGIMQQLGNDYVLNFTSGLRNQAKKQPIPHAQSLGLLSDTELIEAYQNADVLLFPTRYEGFGYAAAEAMACGLPVISSNCSALPELIDEGKGGFLCSTDAIDEFVDKIRLLARSPELCKNMGEYNRQKALAFYNPERMGREYIQLFEQI
ncbi:MAG: glycosyltransferase [Methyloprofundus sp.]|nr:glycosyltransferase [Methyloprofundus sp.]